MSAKAWDKKTAAFAGWLIQHVPEGLTGEDMNHWMGDPDGTREFLSGLKPSPVAVPGKPTPFLSIVAKFNLADGSAISALALSKRATFVEWASAVLGVSSNTSIETLTKLLKESCHTMTSAQIDEMKAAADRGENTGMRTDGWGNLYFVENEDGSVSVGSVDRGGRDWRASVFRLDYGNRWYAGLRLLIRNLDASKLGL